MDNYHINNSILYFMLFFLFQKGVNFIGVILEVSLELLQG